MTVVLASSRPVAAPGYSGPDCDILGLYAIPAAEITAAEHAGIPPGLLSVFFPTAGDGTALSRSGAYYDPRSVITGGGVGALWQARATAARHAGIMPLLFRGVCENLLNVYAAAAYALFEDATDTGDTTTGQRLDQLLEAGTCLAGELAGIPGPWEDRPVPPAPRPSGPLRAFREFDSQQKIADELAWILTGIAAPGSGITALVFPLYGAMTLALAARACTGLDTHMIRLGFHDQAPRQFIAPDGSVLGQLTGPPAHRERLAAACAGRTRVLACDDNAGYGTTLRSVRSLITQYGGVPVTRSAETAWHLYHRSGQHDIARDIDYPGMRPNLHHRVQARLIGHLLRGDIRAYLADPARHVRPGLARQMASARRLAAASGTWTPAQLAAMDREIAYARLRWNEPGVPGPPAPATART